MEYRVKSTSPELPAFPDESSTEDILSRFEEYGNTPPRTRLKIKNRDWDRKQKMLVFIQEIYIFHVLMFMFSV